MQENIPEAVSNNILGTRNVVELAERYNVRRFVMVSSDKAVKSDKRDGGSQTYRRNWLCKM